MLCNNGFNKVGLTTRTSFILNESVIIQSCVSVCLFIILPGNVGLSGAEFGKFQHETMTEVCNPCTVFTIFSIALTD